MRQNLLHQEAIDQQLHGQLQAGTRGTADEKNRCAFLCTVFLRRTQPLRKSFSGLIEFSIS